MDHRAADQADRINAGRWSVLQYVGGSISPGAKAMMVKMGIMALLNSYEQLWLPQPMCALALLIGLLVSRYHPHGEHVVRNADAEAPVAERVTPRYSKILPMRWLPLAAVLNVSAPTLDGILKQAILQVSIIRWD